MSMVSAFEKALERRATRAESQLRNACRSLPRAYGASGIQTPLTILSITPQLAGLRFSVEVQVLLYARRASSTTSTSLV